MQLRNYEYVKTLKVAVVNGFKSNLVKVSRHEKGKLKWRSDFECGLCVAGSISTYLGQWVSVPEARALRLEPTLIITRSSLAYTCHRVASDAGATLSNSHRFASLACPALLARKIQI